MPPPIASNDVNDSQGFLANFLSGVAAICLILFFATSQSPWLVFDDAFITYRYADNLYDGIGFVYNAGENILGITTPLYGLLLAALRLISPDTVVNGYWLSVIGWIGVVVGSIAVLRQHQLFVAATIVPLTLAVHPTLLSILGMETNLLMALMLGTAWAWRAKRFWITIVLAALTLLTRQDSAIFLLLLGFDAWWREQRFPWREGFSTVLLTAPWFIFAWAFYGSPLPNSVGAKIGQSTLMPIAESAIFYENVWLLLTQDTPLLIISSLLIILGVAIWRHGRANNPLQYLPSLWWMFAWLILYILLYTAFGVVYFPWYVAPPIVMLIILVIAVMTTIPLPQSSRLITFAVGLLWLGVVIGWANTSRQDQSARRLNQPYADVATWLATNAQKDATVATIEIGLIGYLSERPIVDTMGLVTEQLTDHQLGWAETLIYALDALEPTYAVALNDTAWEVIAQQWWFNASYQPVVNLDRLTLYERRAALPPTLTETTSIRLKDGIILTGISADSLYLEPSQPFDFDIHLQVDTNPKNAYMITAYLVNAATFEHHAITSFAPYENLYRSSVWQAEDVLQIPTRLTIPDDLPAGAYRVGILLYDMKQGSYLGLRTDHADSDAPDIRIGWLSTRVSPVPQADDIQLQSVNHQWEGGISLSKIGVGDVEDDTVSVLFEWNSAESIKRNLKIFLHLLDSDGQIVTQSDSVPLNGRWPTVVWSDTFIDQHQLNLPATLPNGTYSLRVGFYDDIGQLPLDNNPSSTFVVIDGAVQIEQ